MRYLGGKTKIKKYLHSFFNEVSKDLPFVDLFCGSCNIVEGITTASERYANDNNPYLIDMFNSLVYKDWLPPDTISEEEYNKIRATRPLNALTGFAGVACSYGGKWFSTYAKGEGRNYCGEAKRSLLKKRPLLDGVVFSSLDYKEYSIPYNAVIYCDIPYRNTANNYYDKRFSHDDFYQWVQENKDKAYIYISEYIESVPKGFTIVWQKESYQDMGSKKRTIEVLITPERSD